MCTHLRQLTLLLTCIVFSVAIYAETPTQNYVCPNLENGVLQNEIIENGWQIHLSSGLVAKVSTPPWSNVNIQCKPNGNICQIECFFPINASDSGKISKLVKTSECLVTGDPSLGEFICTKARR